MKYLVNIKYVGDNFAGFQVQKNGLRTVQGELTDIFSAFFSSSVRVSGCSRTDSGVHANCFFVTVETDGVGEPVPPDRLPQAIAHLMPSDISVISSVIVPDSFHVRYNVRSKEYLYRIYVSDAPNPFLHNRAWHLKHEIDESAIERMREGARYIVGRHDFTSFMATGSKIVDAVRCVNYLEIESCMGEINIRISADGFLYNMVRIIVGTLMDVALGRKEPAEISEIIEARNRSRAGATAPACGLYLNCVEY